MSMRSFVIGGAAAVLLLGGVISCSNPYTELTDSISSRVYYDGNGHDSGSPPEPQEHPEGAMVEPAPSGDMGKSEERFAGWKLQRDSGTQEFLLAGDGFEPAAFRMGDEDVTLEAIWVSDMQA